MKDKNYYFCVKKVAFRDFFFNSMKKLYSRFMDLM